MLGLGGTPCVGQVAIQQKQATEVWGVRCIGEQTIWGISPAPSKQDGPVGIRDFKLATLHFSPTYPM